MNPTEEYDSTRQCLDGTMRSLIYFRKFITGAIFIFGVASFRWNPELFGIFALYYCLLKRHYRLCQQVHIYYLHFLPFFYFIYNK